MKQPFARFLTIMSAMSAMISAGMTQAMAMSKSGAANYKSRGKGKGTGIGARIRYSFGKRYPATSAKQHAKHAARQHTVVVNGFPLMQTRRTKDRLSLAA